eukprot:4371705-Amphidinium_carterae.1
MSDSTGLCQTGQVAHFTTMLAAHNVDICVVQETRLRLPEDFTTSLYAVHHQPPINGHGGLATF